MLTINYNGMELEEITEPQIFDPPKLCLCFDDEGYSNKWWVSAILPKSSKRIYPIVAYTTDGTPAAAKHCAFIPEPRRATNRELAKWLAQGKGEWGISKFGVIEKAEIGWFYDTGYEKQTLQSELRVRKWDDTDFHEPTVDYMEIQ